MSNKEVSVKASVFRQRASYWLGVFLLVFFSLIFAMPLFWLIRTALIDNASVLTIPVVWWPKELQWDNFAEVFRKMDFVRYIRNTLFYVILSVVGILFSCPMIAYSITKIPWKGGKYIFPIILFTMMIPWQVTQIPLYSIWAKLGLTDSFVPLILPTFFGSSYYVYLIRQYMRTLPDSVMEAARIDGAGEWRILYTIVYPMCNAVLTTIAVLVFMAQWNDVTGPLLYLQTREKFVLTQGLGQFSDPMYNQWPTMMAASTIFAIPLIVIFFFAQQYFLNGISTTSGLK